jgi:hypothetical protein
MTNPLCVTDKRPSGATVMFEVGLDLLGEDDQEEGSVWVFLYETS